MSPVAEREANPEPTSRTAAVAVPASPAELLEPLGPPHWHGHELATRLARDSGWQGRTPESVLDTPEEALAWLEERVRAAAAAPADSDWNDTLRLWEGLLQGGESIATGAAAWTVAVDAVRGCGCRPRRARRARTGRVTPA